MGDYANIFGFFNLSLIYHFLYTPLHKEIT